MKNLKESKYFQLGLTLIIVVAICMLFNYILSGVPVVWKFIKKLLKIMMPLIYGLVLAYIMNPLVKFFERKVFKGVKKKTTRRNLSILLTICCVVILLATLISIIIPQLLESIQSLLINIPTYLNNLESLITKWLENTELKTTLLSNYDNLTETITKTLNTSLLPATNSAISTLSTGIMGIISFLFNFFIGIVFAIYILANTTNFSIGIRKFLYSLFDVEKINNLVENVKHVNDIFIHFLIGKICDSFCFVAVCTLIYLLIGGYPYALLIAVLIGLTDLIPYFGPYIGTIPAFFLIFLVSPAKAVAFVLFIVILQQIDGNLVTPNIQKQATGLPSFWVLFAITLFGGLFGIVGLLIAVPCFTIIYEIYNNLIKDKLRKKNLPLDDSYYINNEGFKKKEIIPEVNIKNEE